MFPIPREIDARSLYIHVPFCARRCGYCDFSLMVGRDERVGDYVTAVGRELDRFDLAAPLSTVYFGGGTPTHLPDAALASIVEAVQRAAAFAPDCEVTVEGNPNDLCPRKLDHLRQLGVNRLSVGVQSFRDDKLRRLERTHSAAEARDTVARLVAAGWNVSIDLMFGLAGECVGDWIEELRRAAELGVDHVSTYNLTVEKGTLFWNRQQRGESLAADEECAADLYEAAIESLTSQGFEHYEISNFAVPGRACRHNQTYWRGEAWLGLGPGAASYVRRIRWRNHRSPTHYLRSALTGQETAESCDCLTAEQAARERLIFGMRQIAGVDIAEFERSTGWTVWDLGRTPLERWLSGGLLWVDGGRLALTRRGLLVSDALWPELI